MFICMLVSSFEYSNKLFALIIMIIMFTQHAVTMRRISFTEPTIFAFQINLFCNDRT